VEKGGRARLPDFSPIRIEGNAPEAGRPHLFELRSRNAGELIGHPVTSQTV
jgi:threonylcarbamoyladenosine tRNA methylthiotransferase MtaB